MDYAVGIDIGGTKTAVGVVDQQGHIVLQKVLKTDLTIAPEQMINKVIDEVNKMIEKLNATEQIIGIGIGAPGPLDVKNGMITNPPNLTSWRNVKIVEQFNEHFSWPILFENDATAATLAEKWVGAGQESDHFVYLTVSTGVGAGIFSHGQLISGARGNAGDVGHIVIDPSYGTCSCGQRGCFEMIASGTAIAKRGSDLAKEPLTTEEVFKRYEKGDPLMVSFIEDIFEKLGIGCVTLINMLDPDKIIIGGGVSKVGKPLFSAIKQYVSQYALNPSGRLTEIVPAALNQNAGLVGAAALVYYELGKQ